MKKAITIIAMLGVGYFLGSRYPGLISRVMPAG